MYYRICSRKKKIKLQYSPVDCITFGGYQFYIKRDDLLDFDFNGNKARKFYYFLEQDFKNISKIIAYGSAQSNALYSLSVLAKIKGVRLEYYVDHIAPFLKQNPIGNYKNALKNGVKFIELHLDNTPLEEYMQSLEITKNELLIDEGGRIKESQFGISLLAKEIKCWAQEKGFKDLNIFLPSGTGTTALFLQKNIDFPVYTCACVGDKEYLKKQFKMLEKDEKNFPIIVDTPKKFHFGKLYRENYEIYKTLLEKTKIEFDLLYDPIGWLSLLNELKSNTINTKIPLLYIHQGGINGNEAMLERYQRKFL